MRIFNFSKNVKSSQNKVFHRSLAWEVGEKCEKGRGCVGEVPVHAAILSGDGVAARDTSELSLLCSQDVLSAF